MHGQDTPGARKVKDTGIDFALIRTLAFRQCEALVRAWLPDGRRESDEWVARNPTRPDGSLGSFKINLRSCDWADFATGDKGGDLIALRAYLDGSSQADAARAIAAELGEPIPDAIPAGLTLEAYAAAKELPADWLREQFGVETIASPYGKRLPCLSIPYRNRDGSPHRCRLRVRLEKSEDEKKFPRFVWAPPKTARPILYGLDQLPAKGCPLPLVEGESDAHTFWFHEFDAIAVPGAANYKPDRDDAELEGYDLIVFFEDDTGGRALIKGLSKSKHRASIRVARLGKIEIDGKALKDVSDVHLRARSRFADVVNAAIAAAEPLDELLKRMPELDAGREATEDQALAPIGRVEIKLAAGEQARITDEALAVIQTHGDLYERGGALVRLSGETIIEASEHWLADYLSRRVAFHRLKPDSAGGWTRAEADPPGWLGKRIDAKAGERGLHELNGVITAPTLRPDGSLLASPGFDVETGLLLLPGQWPCIPEAPTRAELAAAWKTLWSPFSEFPYVGDADRSVAVAAILTALVRRILPLAPAFSFDAPAAGSGKTLLAECIALLCGSAPALAPECREEEELRKRLLSFLMEGAPSVLLDNIKGQFKSSALEAFLTATRYADRVLGASNIVSLPTNVLFLISGNNFVPVGDLWRRILTCRIDAKVEDAHRRNFKVDAKVHVATHRQAMVAAGLTLLRGFIAAGSPRSTPDRLASFERWDDMVRQAVIWLGKQGVAPLVDPTDCINKAKELDPDRQKLAAFLSAVNVMMGAGKWRTADLTATTNGAALTDANAQMLHDALFEVAGDRNVINPRILGRWIEKQVDRRCGSLRVVRATIKDGNQRWQVLPD
jgi:hypothetical protein